MSDTSDRQHRTGAFWLDSVVAVSAIVISLVSLWVANRSDHTQERLLAASVWPYVQAYTSDYNNGKSELTMNVRNAGVGPALIRWVSFTYKGRPIATPDEFLATCCTRDSHRPLSRYLIMSTIHRNVLVPNQSVSYILVGRTADDERGYELLEHARNDVHLRVCYCSVLGDCWLFDNASEEDPKTVNNCSQVPANAYEG